MPVRERSEAAYQLENELAKRGWGFNQFGTMLGAAQGSVSRLVSGKRLPCVVRGARIEELLGIKVRLWGVPAKRSRKAA